LVVYWVLFALVAVGAIARFEHGTPGPSQYRGLLAVIALIGALVGFRYQVGGDWDSYLHQFDFYRRGLYGPAFGDPGYALINAAAGHLGVGMWAVNLACAGLFCLGLYLLLRSQPNPWLGLLVAVPYLIIVVAMGYTRQSVAIGLVMGALATFDRHHIGRFCLWILAAVMFHKSAIVILPLALLAISANRLVTGAMVLLLTVALYHAFVAVRVDQFVGNYVVQRMDSSGALVRVSMGATCGLVYLLFRPHFRLSPDLSALWRNVSLASLGALVAVLAGVASAAVDRLALYALPLQSIVLTRLTAFVLATRTAGQAAMVVIVALYALVLFVWLTYGAYSTYWIPYRFYPFS